MTCGLNTILVSDGVTVKGFPLKCRCWHCDDCFSLRLWSLKKLALSGSPVSFITLTCSKEDWPDRHAGARALVQSWRNVLQRAEREGLMKGVEYLAVFEETKAGWPHLHIVARMPYLDQQWLSDRMREYMNSPIVYITTVQSKSQIAQYVAKYISKGPGRFEGCKRYWRTRGWDLSKESKLKKQKPVGAWAVALRRVSSAARYAFTACGWFVASEPYKDVWEAIPCEDSQWPKYAPRIDYYGHSPPLSRWWVTGESQMVF